LNNYGFVRLNSKGPDKHGYYHEFLLRSWPRLATLIPRKVGKGPTARYVYDPDTAPYFLGMPWLPETVHALDPQMACNNISDPTRQDVPSDSEKDCGDIDLEDILDTSDDDVGQNDSHHGGEENSSTQRASRLADWATFLEDMDFDAKSEA
jgi:hypothetical protein